MHVVSLPLPLVFQAVRVLERAVAPSHVLRPLALVKAPPCVLQFIQIWLRIGLETFGRHLDLALAMAAVELPLALVPVGRIKSIRKSGVCVRGGGAYSSPVL